MASSPYAFHFDAAACSGCKACQAACKDKHALPVGLLWRRVYEIAGGGWTRDGAAWSTGAFAFNVSIACNHCERPACADACPTRAMHARADGIVLVDPDACMGCRYCEWACPYGAPQYDADTGRMTKCTFCADRIDAGLAPSCVAACPMRALDFGSRVDLEARHGVAASNWPLPDAVLTGPALTVTPHRDMPRARAGAGAIVNREEVSSGAARHRPLVAFTLLMQLAVGWFAGMSAADLAGARPIGHGPFAAVIATALAALGLSFLHLGLPRHAWRALANLRRSWLSREVAFALAFVTAAAAFAALRMARAEPASLRAAAAVASLCGVGLIQSMSRVYRLRTMPAWDTPLTTGAFFAATGMMGIAALGATLGDPSLTALALPVAAWLVVSRARFFRLPAGRPL